MISKNYIINRTINSNTKVQSKVRVQLGYFDIDGSIDAVVERLLEEKLTHLDKGYSDISLSLDYGDDVGEESKSVHIYGLRHETDEEFAQRIKYLDERDANQKKRDLDELERLKKKLGI